MIRGRFSRLAALEREALRRKIRQQTERIAAQYGLPVEELLTEARRIAEGHLHAEDLAAEIGLTADELRSVFRMVCAEMKA